MRLIDVVKGHVKVDVGADESFTQAI